MKRYIREGAESTNAMLTDAMIEQANAIVTEKMNGRVEDMERTCDIFADGKFWINCRTSFDYRDYHFAITDGEVVYKGMEGDFR